MCLIFTDTPDNAPIHEGWLRDFYDHNSDGWGFMWYDEQFGKVQVEKALGTEQEWVAAYNKMRGLGVTFITHLRMRTHGATDLENVHPYHVADNLYMMHNGILSSGYGTSGDTTKSDTWHYIRDTLHPLLGEMPMTVLLSAPMTTLIGASIGNNRFVLMGDGGALSIINAKQGVLWHGRWMSNTYAWSHSLHSAPDQPPPPPRQWGHGVMGSRLWRDDELFEYGSMDSVAGVRWSGTGDEVPKSYGSRTVTPSLFDITEDEPDVQVMEQDVAAQWWLEYDDEVQTRAEHPAYGEMEWVNEFVTKMVTKYPSIVLCTDPYDVLNAVSQCSLEQLVEMFSLVALDNDMATLLHELGVETTSFFKE